MAKLDLLQADYNTLSRKVVPPEIRLHTFLLIVINNYFNSSANALDI